MNEFDFGNNEKRVGRGRPKGVKNSSRKWQANEIEEEAEKYFAECEKRQKFVPTKEGGEWVPWPKPYSIEGFCNWIKIHRQKFDQWRRAGGDLGKACDMIHQRITENRITGALDGTQTGSFAQFMLKNNNPADYADKTNVDLGVDERIGGIFAAAVDSWQNADLKKSTKESGDDER